MNPLAALPRAYGPPLGEAVLRQEAADFQVYEELPFGPSGSGEHLLLRVRKTGWTTDAVAGVLARSLDVGRREVSYAGMKDRHAVTEQHFSVQLAGRQTPELPRELADGVELLWAARHHRKLRRGALSGNRFRLRLRGLSADYAALSARLAAIARGGVPNYFGEQRFGREGDNVARARDLLAGRFRTRNRNLRGILYSAARSELFNRVLAERIADGSWQRGLAGDVMMLDGRSACFTTQPADPQLGRRLALMEIHPTGPMPGKGGLVPEAAAGEVERRVLEAEAELVAGLIAAGLDADRRALRLRVRELAWHSPAPGELWLEFGLPAGAYATTVVRELVETVERSRFDTEDTEGSQRTQRK